MGFLNRDRKNEEAPAPDEGEVAEEQFQNMYPKIAREFVHREDVYAILEQFVTLLIAEGIVSLRAVNIKKDDFARIRAAEYKALVDAGDAGQQLYPDLGEEDGDST